MDRLEHLRAAIDEVIRQQPDREESRCGFVHLYGVAQACALLAARRGLDQRLCTTAGMLHDIWAYKTGDPTSHAELGSPEAEKMLRECGGFTDEEIEAICRAISNHSDKTGVHDEISEVLKDADVLQHHLYNASLGVHASHMERLSRVFRELSLPEPTTKNQCTKQHARD